MKTEHSLCKQMLAEVFCYRWQTVNIISARAFGVLSCMHYVKFPMRDACVRFAKRARR